VTAYRQNPERLAAWASQLAGGSEVEMANARYQLLRAHSAAVSPLVQQYSLPGNAAGATQRIDEIIIALGDDAVGPFLGYLEGDDEQSRLTAMHLLALLRAPEAVEYLVGPAVAAAEPEPIRAAAAAALKRISGKATTAAEAATILERRTRAKLAEALRGVGQPDRIVRLWRWDEVHKDSIPVSYRADDAALATAARLAVSLYRIDSSRADYQRLYAIALLADAQVRAGLDQPLSTEKDTVFSDVSALGASAIDDALAEALRINQRYAAMAACQILGEIGSERLLAGSGETASPLARAAAHDDRRIRFRAVQAILNFRPTQSFVGSSHVTEALGYFAAASNARRMLITHPRTQLGQQIAGMLREQGFEADVATTGREAFRLATTTPDYEFALVHMAIGSPRIEELLAQFRRDWRTARLPVGIVAVADNLAPAERLAGYAQPASALVHPAGLAPMQRESATLLMKWGRDLVPVEVRQYQAEVMLDNIVTLASSSQKIFDLRQLIPAVEQSLRNPRLAVRAALVLGHLGSPNGQRALVALAARSTQPIAVREAALTAFQGSVLRHGLLLTSDEVQAQYNRYNINGGRDAELHQLLAAILDTIEGSSTHAGGAPPANAAVKENL
jgi:hypothetical protein